MTWWKGLLYSQVVNYFECISRIIHSNNHCWVLINSAVPKVVMANSNKAYTYHTLYNSETKMTRIFHYIYILIWYFISKLEVIYILGFHIYKNFNQCFMGKVGPENWKWKKKSGHRIVIRIWGLSKNFKKIVRLEILKEKVVGVGMKRKGILMWLKWWENTRSWNKKI